MDKGYTIIEGELLAPYRLLAIKQAIKLEALGLRHSSGKSAVKALEAVLGRKIPGTGQAKRQAALAILEGMLKQ